MDPLAIIEIKYGAVFIIIIVDESELLIKGRLLRDFNLYLDSNIIIVFN